MTLGAQWHKMKKWCEISHVKMLQYIQDCRRKEHGPYYEILNFFLYDYWFKNYKISYFNDRK